MRSGLDIYVDVPYLNGAVGLLTTAASQTSDGRTAYQALREAGVAVSHVFAPESGYYGIGATREIIPDLLQPPLPVRLLNGTPPRPTRELLKPLSGLVVDLQDVGTRFHTYAHLLYETLIGCAESGTPILVLDRPNPLSGTVVEGPLLSADYVPYYLPCELPIRHGLTYGELARLMNDTVGANLQIIAMEGWGRHMFYPQTRLPWTSPSPDVPTFEAALLYPGTSLLECFALSVAHGTSLTYQQVGAPYIDAEMLTAALNGLYLSGVSFTPTWFRPSAGNYAGQPCEGVRIHVADSYQFHCVELALYLIMTVRDLHPSEATWAGAEGAALFDALVGAAHIREEMDAERAIANIVSDYQLDAANFQSNTAEYWLYE